SELATPEVESNCVEPGAKFSRSLIARRCVNYAQESLLHNIFSQLARASTAENKIEQLMAIASYQLQECCFIATTKASHQVLIRNHSISSLNCSNSESLLTCLTDRPNILNCPGE